MCKCTPEIKTPFCGKEDCQWPQVTSHPVESKLMNLENHVPSLELSKQLKEAGYPQEKPLFSYVAYRKEFEGNEQPSFSNGFESNEFNWVAAPLASELGEQLPDFEKLDLATIRIGGEYNVGYKNEHGFWEMPLITSQLTVSANTEANARAKMWLYLKKEGLLT